MALRRILLAGALALATAAATAAPALATEPDPGVRALVEKAGDEETVPVIVTLRSRADQQPLLDELDRRGQEYDVGNRYSVLPLLALEVDADALEQLADSPRVQAIQENKLYDVDLDNSIPWINANDVHTLGFAGANQAVAILDTGIDRDHPFFAGRIVAEACFSTGGGDGGVSLCPNGNASQTGAGSADAETAQCLDGTTNICDHGSHVAGIAAGNESGVTGAPEDGVARSAGIIAIQVFTRFNTAAQCGAQPGQPPPPTPCVRTWESDYIDGLEQVLTLSNTIDIAAANMSLGDGARNTAACDGNATKTVIDDLLDEEIATVISSGNDGHTDGVGAPGCVSTAITVGGTQDSSDALYQNGNRGPLLDLFAPGQDIESSVPDDGWAVFTGTSMAAPHVAGAFAVLRAAYPNATVATLLGYLRDTGVDVTYTSGTGQATTPRIDLLAALRAGNADPTIGVDHPTVTVDEGATATNTGTFGDVDSSTVTLDASIGTVTKTGAGSWSWSYGTNDGPTQSGTVHVTAVDDKGEGVGVDFALTVRNVAPAVARDPAQVTTIAEGSTLQAKATFSDPGWADTYAGSIDWGTGTTTPGALTVTGNGPPADTGELTGSHPYGDNGSYGVTLSVTDDDGGKGSASFTANVTNVAPTATIDESGATVINGVPTFIAHSGSPIAFKGRSTDPGSDDLALSWDWGDGAPAPDVTTPYLVNPPNADPANSPSVQPRDVTDAKSRTFGKACTYTVGFTARDDDGGTSSDTARVVVTGNASHAKLAVYWWTQTRSGPRIPSLDLPVETVNCYLQVAQHLSAVFSEVRDVSTMAKAHDLLAVTLLNPKRDFDRQALAAWLNYANGSFDLSTPVDTNYDLKRDSTFGAVMAKAEAIRLDPASTNAQLAKQTLLLDKLNTLGF